MHTMWEVIAMEMHETYGAMVDFDEKFFICPECGEPVYADDWEDIDFDGVKCPLCFRNTCLNNRYNEIVADKEKHCFSLEKGE